MNRYLRLLLLVLVALPVSARAQLVPSLQPAAPLVPVRQAESVSWSPSGAVTFGRDPYRSAEVAVDAEGGLHTAFVSLGQLDDASHKPAFYAYCPPTDPAACAEPSGWRLVEVAVDAAFVQLALDPEGRPRLFLYNDRADIDDESATVYAYAACDQDCTTPSGWRLRVIETSRDAGNVDSDRHPVHRFALDPQGRPRFVYYYGTRWLSDTQWEQPSYYAYCDADCAGAGAWEEVRLPDSFAIGYDQDLENAALAFTPDGSPRLLYTADLPYEGNEYDKRAWLVYAECASPCRATQGWSAPAPILFLNHGTGDRSFSLAAGEDGRIHLAAKPIDQPLVYAWCDGDCTDPVQWEGYALGLDVQDGEHPTLVLDREGRPRIAYKYAADDEYGLGYAWCEADCRENGAVWQSRLIEDEDALFEAVPVALAPGCIEHYWQGGLRPTLALDATGNTLIGYDADYVRRCYYDPRHPENGSFIERTYWTSRFVFFPHPGGVPTSSEPTTPAVPTGPTLGAAHPNPTRTTATLPLSLAAPGPARLAVYDALGREVAVLLDGLQPAGEQVAIWDGGTLPSGLYFVRLDADGAVTVRTLTLLH